MDYSLISVRYAKALFALSKEKGLSKEIYQDITLLKEQYKVNKDFSQFITSPVIPATRKKELFNTVFQSQVNELTIKFLITLVDNGREILLIHIAHDFADMYKKEQNIKSVSLYTAIELNADFIETIKNTLETELSSKVELSVFVKEHLIGGFMLMLDGKLIDTSVYSKLKRIKKQLLS